MEYLKMADDKQFPRPNVKIINVTTGEEIIEPMSDDEYHNWLAECRLNTSDL